LKVSSLLIIGLLLFCYCGIYAQGQYNVITVTDSIPIKFNTRHYISAISIIPFSETVQLNKKLLSRDQYNISYTEGYITLLDSLPYSIYDTLIITYRTYLTSLKKEYRRRSLVYKYDEQTYDTLQVLKSETDGFSTESIFGKDMQKSGTIMRGFTIGTTRDFTLNSGLRLQLSGKLSDEIDIVAALTDENTPIQPEGNTETLDELDKVFIEIKHRNASGIFGDYSLSEKTGEFGAIDRKLQGLKGDFNLKNYSGSVAVAGSKGKFNINQFSGLEGVQGPYRLTGENNIRDIIVIAGSEKVYIDGEVMKRGERNDYIIDYSTAEIIFTPYRLITSASRITVDFEYSDRRYSRNFFSSGLQTSQFDDILKLNINVFREGDDQDSPIDISLSDEDRTVLSAAGDDRTAAVKSGVILAQPDSTGKIVAAYTSRDTVINGSTITYYIYSPQKAMYNITFSFVGEGKGDYIKEGFNRYRYGGPGSGAYSPVIFLPLPELKQVGNIGFEFSPVKDIDLSFEFAGSTWDRNRFSTVKDDDNFGSARNILFNIKPRELNLFNLNIGKFGAAYKDRFIQDRFTTLDRINEVEFNRNYNLNDQSSGNDEQLREAMLTYSKSQMLDISSSYGFLKRGSNYTSDRFLNNVKFQRGDNLNINYTIDHVASKAQTLNSNWLRQSGTAFYSWNRIRPGFNFLSEDRSDRTSVSDSLHTGSIKFYEVIPSFEVSDVFGFNVKAEYSYRKESAPVSGKMETESRAYTQAYEMNYSGIPEVNSSIRLVIRNKKYSGLFQSRGSLNNESILIRSQSRVNFLERAFTGDIYYEVSTQRSAKLERIFIRVPVGTGSYRYTGDLNNNGIAEEFEFEPAVYDADFIVTTIPTDQLFPVIDVRANTRWKIEPGKMLDKNSLAGKIFAPFSSETFFRIEENSRESDTRKIYLLNFSSFLNDSTTLNGFNYFQQDLFLFENQTDLSFRFRYSQRRSLNQFSIGSERAYSRERSLRIRFQMLKEIGNQTDLISETDYVSAPAGSNRARMINSNGISTDFSYRPYNNIEVGFKITVSRSEDRLPSNPTIIDQNSLLTRVTYSIAGKGRLRTELERSELNAGNTMNFIPFEMTRGNSLGKNYIWRVNFDYRLTGNLQSMLNYDGRIHGNNKAVHTARAEMRAYF